MKNKDIEVFEKAYSQLEGLHQEIGLLSKKSPNDGVNKFKLRFVNLVLSQANSILTEQYEPFSDFKSFDEIEIPTNSDVALIISQYLNCMEKLRADNIASDGYNWHWLINGRESSIETAPPKRIQEKK